MKEDKNINTEVAYAYQVQTYSVWAWFQAVLVGLSLQRLLSMLHLPCGNQSQAKLHTRPFFKASS